MGQIVLCRVRVEVPEREEGPRAILNSPGGRWEDEEMTPNHAYPILGGDFVSFEDFYHSGGDFDEGLIVVRYVSCVRPDVWHCASIDTTERWAFFSLIVETEFSQRSHRAERMLTPPHWVVTDHASRKATDPLTG
jgi:hypothetical protein